ncbi:MAG: hypothetical protein ACHQK9_06140 [Reyranellales bacterium]
MVARRVRQVLMPLLLVGGLSACAADGVPPGYVATPGVATASAPVQGAPAGEVGRVVSINEIDIQGRGGGGNGPLIGGLLGAAGGATYGGISGGTFGSGLVGGVLGAVGGAILGSIFDGQKGGGRGIEIVVEKDDGQKVTIAQYDDGDIQLGDRVRVVQDAKGVAKAVRETAPKTN